MRTSPRRYGPARSRLEPNTIHFAKQGTDYVSLTTLREQANARGKQKVDEEDEGEDEESEEGEGADDEDEDEGSVLLYHSLRNPAELHMSGHRNEPSLLRFPLNHLPALRHLVAVRRTQ